MPRKQAGENCFADASVRAGNENGQPFHCDPYNTNPQSEATRNSRTRQITTPLQEVPACFRRRCCQYLHDVSVFR
jgi:hypothetical protein